jgi:hypothetical protein
MAVAAITLIVGTFLLKETNHILIWKELETDRPDQLVSDIEGPV